VLLYHNISHVHLYVKLYCFGVFFQFDLEKFEEKYVDLKWLESKKAQSEEPVYL
jgi:hypothetical protein